VGGALLALPMFAHSDDGDAQLYQVVVRHMLEDRTWTDLRYEPNVHPHYREHLPFGLWPYRIAVQLFGEGALTPVGFLFGLATLLATGLLARRLFGDGAGVAAVLVLGLTESFYDVAGRARLDGPLLLFATLAAAPVLVGAKRGWLWALLAASAAVLIKGPFGLLPLVAACVVMRKPLGLLVAAAATLPALLFLYIDDSWWRGYVVDQLLASATGARTDGQTAFYLPLRVLVGRFWPGLPLLVLAARDKQLRTVLLWSLAILVLLCLPARKLWFHALVAFPALAIAAGAAARQWLERRHAAPALAAVAALLWLGDTLGLAHLAGKKPYIFCTAFAPYFRPAGTQAVVIADWPWHAISSLAAERGWIVYRGERLEGADVAFVADDSHVDTTGWTVRAHAQDWTILERP
jgi:4-amino-4-deoxy-L-arabinose transferase-like glycosyltransferase